MTTETYEERLAELKQDLESSIGDTIRILQSVLDDVKNGIYGPEQAKMDHENMMFNDGINYMSIIDDIANLEEGI
jgi:DNA relaxase NicK